MAKNLKLINRAISKEYNEIIRQVNNLKYMDDIEIAYGKHLDYIATLFGLERRDEETDAELRKRIGGVKIVDGKPVKFGKIASNCSEAGRDDMIQVAEGVIDADNFTTKESPGAITILVPEGEIDNKLSPQDEANELTETQARLIKKAVSAGVRLYILYVPDNYFGFDGDSEANTFGDAEDDTVGGIFCGIIAGK